LNTTHRARPFSLVVPQGSPEGGVAGSFINIQPGCFQGMPANKPFNEAVRATPHHMAQSSPLLFCPCQNLTTYLGTLFPGKKNISFKSSFWGTQFLDCISAVVHTYLSTPSHVSHPRSRACSSPTLTLAPQLHARPLHPSARCCRCRHGHRFHDQTFSFRCGSLFSFRAPPLLRASRSLTLCISLRVSMRHQLTKPSRAVQGTSLQ